MIPMKLSEKIATLLGKMPEESPYGMLAEFKDATALYHAAQELRDAGYKRFDVHSPFPIHGMDRAMGLGRSKVPLVCFLGGVAGFCAGLGLQLFVDLVEYPLVIGGKPHASIPAFIPITFELTILLASFGAVLGMIAMNFLPMLYHPLFNCAQFQKVTDDGFFVSIEARDDRFDAEATRGFLESIGGRNIELVEP